MIALLPQPQETHYTPESFRATRKERIWLTSRDGHDTLAEVLASIVRRVVGQGVRPTSGSSLPTAHGLAIAADAQTARELVAQAAQCLRREVKTYILRPDGVYMDEPRDGMGLRKPAEHEILANQEAYFLLISPRGVAVAAPGRRGLFYGVLTLGQIAEGSPGGLLPGVLIRDWPTQRVRGVHIDMKYMHHKPGYLESYVRRLATLKLNTVLLEYEDKFPFSKHAFLRHKAAMTPAELRSLLDTCRRYHVDAIPLVQTLGHLEFAIKHPELAHLRETPEVYTQCCPTNPDSLPFVLNLIDEVMAYHTDAPYFFIGGDETEFLGECPRCATVAAERGAVNLYLDHILKVVRHVMDKGKRPVLWDDIVRRDAARAERLPREVILAHWIYETVRERHGERKLPPALEEFYQTEGKRPALWPDTLSAYPHHDFYRQLGFDVLAVPCFNHGTLVPNYPVAVWNTNTWAEKNVVCDGMGLINSQWASFRTPMETAWYGLAVTAEATWNWPNADMFNLETRFTRAWFGIEGADLVTVMNQVSEGVGFPSSFKRPLNLLHYAYMDCVIHYAGNMRERQRKGAVIADLDLLYVLKMKLEALEKEGLLGEVRQRLDRVEALMLDALPKLADALAHARREKACLRLYQRSAEFKLWRIQLARLLLDVFAHRNDDGGPRRAEIEQALRTEEQMRRMMRRAYAGFLHPKEMAGEMRAMFDGEKALLGDLLAAGYRPPVRRGASAESGKGANVF